MFLLNILEIKQKKDHHVDAAAPEPEAAEEVRVYKNFQ